MFNPNLDFIKEKEIEVVVDRCRLFKKKNPRTEILELKLSKLTTMSS